MSFSHYLHIAVDAGPVRFSQLEELGSASLSELASLQVAESKNNFTKIFRLLVRLKSNLHYTRAITSGGIHLRGSAPGHGATPLRKNVVAAATLCPICQTQESNPQPYAKIAMYWPAGGIEEPILLDFSTPSTQARLKTGIRT